MALEDLSRKEWIQLGFLIGLFLGSISMYYLIDIFQEPEPVNVNEDLACFPSDYSFEYSHGFNESPEVTVIPSSSNESNVSGVDG